MINKNYRNGAEDVGKIAAKGFKMIGKEIKGSMTDFKEYQEKQSDFEDGVLDELDALDERLKANEYGFSANEISLIDRLEAEKKIVIVSTLCLLSDVDKTGRLEEYLGVAVFRFGVRKIIKNDGAHLEKLVGQLNNEEAALLMRMIDEMLEFADKDSAAISVGHSISKCLCLSEVQKEKIQSEVSELSERFGSSIFIKLLVRDCSPAQFTENRNESEDQLESDLQYEACEKFYSFTGGKKKFSNIDINFMDRYNVSDTILQIENCTLIFGSSFSPVVEFSGCNIVFRNCRFYSLREIPYGAFDTKNSDIMFDNCIFEDWKSGPLLKMSGGKLSIVGCLFLNCAGSMISADGLTALSIDTCTIKGHIGQLAGFIAEKANENPIELNDCTFTDCNVKSEAGILSFLNSDVLVNRTNIKNSSINVIDSLAKGTFNHCKFEHCRGDFNPVFGHGITFEYCDISDYVGDIGTAVLAIPEIKMNACKLKDIQSSFFTASAQLQNTIFKNCAGNSEGVGIYTENYLYISGEENPLLSALATYAPTGSIFEIKPDKDAPVNSFINGCKFIDCKSKGALVFALSEHKNEKEYVRIEGCELIGCQCSEGYFFGAYKKGNKYIAFPDPIKAWNNKIDVYDKCRDELFALLKEKLTKGLVKGCQQFHKLPLDYELEHNIQEKIMHCYDEVLLMYDDTLFGKGKTGLVFGRKAVYFSLSMDANYTLPYEKIALMNGIDVVHKKFGDNYDATLRITLGNDRVIIFSNPYLEKNELKKVLSCIAGAYNALLNVKRGI